MPDNPLLGKDAEHELQTLLEMRKVHEGIGKIVNEEKKAWVDAKGKILEAKKASEEWADATKNIKNQLKDSGLSAKEIALATGKATVQAMALAKAYKLTAEQASELQQIQLKTDLAAVKAAKEQKTAAKEKIADMAKSKLGGWARDIAAVAGGAKVLDMNLKEAYKGQELFLASTTATGSAADKTWKQLPQYIDAYRKSSRDAANVAARWGVSAEEVRETLGSTYDMLAGRFGTVTDYKKAVDDTTNSLYAYSKMSGQTVPEAQEDMQRSLRSEGKTFNAARKDLNTAVAGYNILANSVRAAAKPTRKEYFTALRDVRHELGPVMVNVNATAAAMTAFAEASSKAGGSAQNIKDSMAALPKVLEGLPRYFKIKIGQGYMNALRPGNKEMEAFVAKLGKEDKTGNLLKRSKAIMGLGLSSYKTAEKLQNLYKGTKFGMEDTLKGWGSMSSDIMSNELEKLGLNQDQVTDAMLAIRSGNKKGLKEAAKNIETEQKKLKQESLPERLKQNADMVSAAAIATNELKASIVSLIEKNAEVATGIGLASAVGSKLIDVMTTVSSAGGLQSALGSVVGALNPLSLAIAAMTIGFLDFQKKKEMAEAAKEAGSKVFITELERYMQQYEAGKISKKDFDKMISSTEKRLGAGATTPFEIEKADKELAWMKTRKDLAESKLKVTAALGSAGAVRPEKQVDLQRPEKQVDLQRPEKQVDLQRAQAEKVTENQKREDKRWAPPPPVATATVNPKSSAPPEAAKRLSQSAGSVQGAGAATPPKPAQLKYDATTQQLTVINLRDPSLQQAASDFFGLMGMTPQQKR